MQVITLEAGQMDKNQKDRHIAELTRVASDILKSRRMPSLSLKKNVIICGIFRKVLKANKIG